MYSIAKIGAAHLRAFSNQHGVKLKSSHAHELVAAFFGYKSKASMQADTLCSVENLVRAQIFVLMPSLFIDQRRQCLEGLPTDLPNTYALSEELFVYLASEERLSAKPFPSWVHLAAMYTEEHLLKYGDFILPRNFGPFEKAHRIFNKPLYEFNPKIETTENDVKLTVSNRYYGSVDVNFQWIDVTLLISLQRIAGHVGYAKPEISIMNVANQSVEQGVL